MLFVLNMVAVSMVLMAAIILIILRERTDTQLLIAAVFFEAIMALLSLMWIEPPRVDLQLLMLRLIGRVIEGIVFWIVIAITIRSIHKTTLTPTSAETLQKKLDELEQKLAQKNGPEEDHNAITH